MTEQFSSSIQKRETNEKPLVLSQARNDKYVKRDSSGMKMSKLIPEIVKEIELAGLAGALCVAVKKKGILGFLT